MLQMKTTVSLGREGHCNEIRKTLSQALLTVALVLAAFLPRVTAQSCVLACHNAQVSLDQQCQALVTVSMLADTLECPEGQFGVYIVTLDGDTIPSSPYVTEAERGDTLIAHVYDLVSGQSCWSYIHVEDKLPPVMDCNCPPVDDPSEASPDCIVNCLEAVNFPPPDIIENCPGGAHTILLNETITPICDSSFIRRLERQYTAVDASGNYADTCTQVLFLHRIDFGLIDWPDSLTVLNGNAVECDAPFLDEDPADGIPDAAPIWLGGAGVPMIDGIPIYPDFINDCNAQIFYEDVVIGTSGCVKKIMRMWRAFEWHCQGEHMVLHTQLIEIVDNKGPDLVCPADVTVSTGNVNCQATVFVPVPPNYEDNCNDVIQISVAYPYGFIDNILETNGAYIQLPVGENSLTYKAYDECYNHSVCTWTVTVEDHTVPVAICDAHTVVSLTNEYTYGLTLVEASAFDDGSYDECGPVTFKARRMTSCIDFDWTDNGEDENPDGYVNGHDTGLYLHSYVPFACCDVNSGPIMVELQVTDASGNTNSCMVEITVQDKLSPVIECPNDITISCDYPLDLSDLSVFGTVRTDPDDRQDICVFDPTNPHHDGNGFVCIGLDGLAQDNCMVSVTVDSTVDLNVCGTGNIWRTFVATDPGGRTASCQQHITIENYHPFYINDVNCNDNDPNDGVIWPCNVEVTGCGGNTEPDVTGEPIIFEDHCDLVGVNHEDQVFQFVQGVCLKILRTWRVIDWCQYGPDGNGGYYGYWQYQQIIKVINTEAPTFTTDQDTISVCNNINCDDLYVEVSQSATDDCTPDDQLRASCQIDLYNDGIIDFSSSGFGATIDASRYFPIGTHRIIYGFEDGCGSQTVRQQIVQVFGCKPPTPVCKALSADLMPTGMLVVWAKDFDASSNHACGYPITFSFSQDTTDKSRIYTCDSLGINTVQLWVTDLVLGQQDFCTTTIDIQDHNNACTGQNLSGTIAGQISTESSQDVKNVNVSLQGSGLAAVNTDGTGVYAFPSMPFGGTYQVMPERNTDWKNGVSTLDLILIQKHLLGMQTLSSPYKMIAADANKSGNISALDIVALRRLILGVDSEVTGNTSWRFVDKKYNFIDPANPFNEQFAESVAISPFSNTMPDVDFIAIKVGDINNTVVANLNNVATRSNPETVQLQAKDIEFVPGQEFEVAVEAGQAIQLEGYQFTLNFDPSQLAFESYSAGAVLVNDDNFNFRDASRGSIETSWSDAASHAINEGTVLFTLKFKALSDGKLSKTLRLSSDPTIAEAYNAEDQPMDLGLIFRTETVTPAAQAEFELLENRPNPFTDATTVIFITPRASAATVTIYDVTGRVVYETVVDAHIGINEVEIRNLKVKGVLYCQVSTDGFSATRKMIRIE